MLEMSCTYIFFCYFYPSPLTRARALSRALRLPCRLYIERLGDWEKDRKNYTPPTRYNDLQTKVSCSRKMASLFCLAASQHLFHLGARLHLYSSRLRSLLIPARRIHPRTNDPSIYSRRVCRALLLFSLVCN